MKRRKLLKLTGSSALLLSSLDAVANPAVATDFELDNTIESDIQSVDSVGINFSKFSVKPLYTKENDLLVTVTIRTDDSSNFKSITLQDVFNGTEIDISDRFNNLQVDISNRSDSSINGDVEIKVEGSGVKEYYVKNFSIVSPSLPNSAVSRWTFDNSDTDNNTLSDKWGSNDATIQGDINIVEGISTESGDAYEFTGSNSYLQIPEINIGEQWSISSWVEHKDENDYTHIFTSSISQNNFALKIGREGLGTEPYFYSNSTGSVQSPDEISPNTPHHIVFTYDGSTLRIYVDGVEKISRESDVPNPSAQNFQLQGGNDEYTSAIHDDLRYYDEALTGDEVSNLYSTGRIN